MLSAQAIKLNRMARRIVIEPFDEDHIQPNGYDITLGDWVARFIPLMRKTTVIRLDEDLSNMYDLQKCVDTVTIESGERLLCHTREFFGSVVGSVPCLATRSTLARLGLDICGSAGFGDVGYINRWTLELQNNSPYTYAIPIGSRIGQVYFNELYGGGTLVYKGGYNLEHGGYRLSTMEKEWTPSMMLPKEVSK